MTYQDLLDKMSDVRIEWDGDKKETAHWSFCGQEMSITIPSDIVWEMLTQEQIKLWLIKRLDFILVNLYQQ